MLHVPVETLRQCNPFSDLKLIGVSAEDLALGEQGELLVTASSYPTARNSHGQQHCRNGNAPPSVCVPRLHGCGSEKEQLRLSKESSLLGERGVSKENGLAKEINNSLALGFCSFLTMVSSSSAARLALAGEEWSFFSGTGQVLWFVVWTKPALETPQCFTHCPAGLAQHQGLFFSTLCPHSE